jgi:hypothetical protein
MSSPWGKTSISTNKHGLLDIMSEQLAIGLSTPPMEENLSFQENSPVIHHSEDLDLAIAMQLVSDILIIYLLDSIF